MQRIVYGMFPNDQQTDFFTVDRKALYNDDYKYLGPPNGVLAQLSGDSASQYKVSVMLEPMSLPANAQVQSLSFGVYTPISSATLAISTTPGFLTGTLLYSGAVTGNTFYTLTTTPALSVINGPLYLRLTFGGVNNRAVDAFVAYADYTVPAVPIKQRTAQGTWANVTSVKQWDGTVWKNAQLVPVTLPASRQRDMRQFFPQIDAATSIANMEAPTKPIEDEYGLRANALHVNYSQSGFDMTMASFSNPKLKPAYKVMVDNLAMYPPAWLNAITPMDALFLCDSVTSGGQAYGGIAMSGTGQAFMSLEGTGNPVFANTVFAGADFVFHHELQHLFYYAYTTEFQSFQAEWTSWNTLPYSSATYTSYGATRPEGHIRSYGVSSFMEDIADVHAAIMTTPFQEQLAQLVAEDPIVAKKVKFLKGWLATKSTIMGHPRYFQAIHNLPSA